MEQIWSAEPHKFLNSVKESIYLFNGITDATMSQSEGWHFIRTGRFLERAMATSALVDAHFTIFPVIDEDGQQEALDYLSWVGLLRSCASFEAYCKVHTAVLRPYAIAEYLLLNPEVPRSIRFACSQVQSGAQAIAKATSSRNNGRIERLTGRLSASVDFYQIDEILNDNIHEYLASVQQQCSAIHAGLYQTYLAYPIEVALLTRGGAQA
jgi:uncharacterized alpha-E superfamily protein